MAMGILAAGIALGGVVGIWLGGHLELNYGWRMALVAVSVPGFAIAVFSTRLPDPLRHPPVPLRTWLSMGLSTISDYLVPPLLTVLRTPTLLYVFAAGALISFGTNGLVGWAPTFMARELGLSVAKGAQLLGTYGLGAGIAGALCGGMVADWLRRYTPTGRVITISVGLLIGGSLAVWLLTVRDLDLFVPVFTASFFFLSWFNGPISATIFDVVPARISTTVAGAYLLFIHLVGDSIAFPLVGTLSDRFGLHRAVLLLPIMAILGGHRRARRAPNGAVRHAETPARDLMRYRALRYISSISSSYMASACAGSPDRIALVAQCLRWLWSRPRPTPRRASCTDDTWVSTSAQYRSSSIIR